MLSTNNLYHYTNSKENLLSIIENGFQPRYSHEKLGIYVENEILLSISNLLDSNDSKQIDINDEFAILMCCFCDIPLNLVQNHMAIYGNYAIGLNKSWGEKQALSPVVYLPKYGETRVLFERLVKNFQKYFNTSIQKPKSSSSVEMNELFDTIIELTMFLKPYCGSFQKGSYQNDCYKFYDEREWRYKPINYLYKSYLNKEEYNSFISIEEPYKNIGFLKFDSEDISDIIVPKDNVKELRELVLKIPRFDKINTKIIDTIENRR